MKILFLGDVVGISGRSMVLNNLLSKIKDEKIDFVVVNGENAADSGVGLTEEICKDFFNCGVDVITTGNHVWDQKETMSHIEKENIVYPDVLLIPLVAFDKNLNRLGYGGGYYDRLIKKLSKKKKYYKNRFSFFSSRN